MTQLALRLDRDSVVSELFDEGVTTPGESALLSMAIARRKKQEGKYVPEFVVRVRRPYEDFADWRIDMSRNPEHRGSEAESGGTEEVVIPMAALTSPSGNLYRSVPRAAAQ